MKGRNNATPSVQRQIVSTRRWLQTHRWLRLHVGLIALACLGCLWLTGAALRMLGVDSLALRFTVSLAVCYGVYLLLLRLWAAYLLSREDADVGDAADVLDAVGSLRPGGGFEEGGAAADIVGSTVDAASSLDEGALVLLPVLAVIGMVLALAALLGTGVTLLFGVEVLMAVSVEVALAAFAAGLAWRHQRQFEREGWLRCALQHTWPGALALLVAGAGLGAALDRWMPEAQSLPHAVQLWRGR